MTPNKPKTPHSSIRIPVELKQAAQTKAANEQPPRTLTDVVVQGLEQYVSEPETTEQVIARHEADKQATDNHSLDRRAEAARASCRDSRTT